MRDNSDVNANFSETYSPDRLTIILTLKGRETFTPRWIEYHSRVGLPWKVIVGDGAPSDRTQSLFERTPDIRVSYRRYDDCDLSAYYHKLRDLVAAAETPYVMLCDNDDFILPDGVARSVRFLDAKPDYVSCGGMVPGVSVGNRNLASHNAAYGETVFGLRPLYPAYELTSAQPTSRVLSLIRSYTPTWYAVHRRAALTKSLDELIKIGVSDVYVMELFVAAMLAAIGKQTQKWNHVNYLRQMNSSQILGGSADFFTRALGGSAPEDYRKLVTAVSAQASTGTEEERAEFSMRLLAEIVDYARRQSVAPTPQRQLRLWAKRYVHTFRAKMPGVRRLFSAAERASLLRALRNGGADDQTVAAWLGYYRIVEELSCAGPDCRRSVAATELA